MKKFILAFAFISGLMVSCKSESNTPSTPVHAEWRAVEIAHFSETISEETAPTLRLVMAHASGQSGCNQYSGAFSISGDKITFTEFAGTRKMCAPEQMNVENAYLEAIQHVKTWKIEDDKLELIGEDGITWVTYVYNKDIKEDEQF